MEELSNEEDKYLTRVLYNNLGNTYLSDGDFYNAEKYYKKSLEKESVIEALLNDMKKKYSIEEKDLEEYKDILFNL